MIITKENFEVLAIKAYDSAQCTGIDEVLDDIDRFIHIHKLFLKYEESGELKDRLIMNHIITLFNVFGEETLRFLFFKIKPEHYKIMLPFLAYLNRVGDFVEISGKKVPIKKLGYDKIVANRLLEIYENI